MTAVSTAPADARPLGPVGWCSLGLLGAMFGSFAVVNICLGLAALLALLRPEVRREGWAMPRSVALGLGLFGGWVLLSLVASPDTWVAGADLSPRRVPKAVLAFLVGFAATRHAPDLLRRAARWVGWLAVAFLLPTLPSFDGVLSLSASVYGREILGPNVLGGVLAILALLALGEALRDPEGRRAHGLRLVALLGGVAMTGSRSALLLLAGGLAAQVFLVVVRGGQARIAVAALLAVGLVVVSSPRLRNTVSDPASLSHDLRRRVSIWEPAVAVIRERPLLGTGSRRYQDKLDELFPDWIYTTEDGTNYYTDRPQDFEPHEVIRNPLEAHNDYLTLAARHGLPAVLFYLAWMGAVLAYLVPRAEDGLVRGVLMIAAGHLAYMVFNAVVFNQELGLFFCWFVGAGLGRATHVAPEAAAPS